jgi:hypothetical protein
LEISSSDLLQSKKRSKKASKGHVTCLSAVPQEKGDCICYYGTSRGDCGSLSISDGGKAYSKGWHTEAVHEKGTAVRLISGGSNEEEEDDKEIFSVGGEAGESIELSQLNAETGESVKAFKEGLDTAALVQGMHVLADKSYAFLAVGKGTFHLYSFVKEKSICTLVSSEEKDDREVAGFASCLNDKFLVGAYAGTSQLDVWKFTRKATTKPQAPSCSIALPAGGKKGSSSIESCAFHHSEPLVAVVAAASKGKSKKTKKAYQVYLYKLDLKVAAGKVKDATTLLATIDCDSSSDEVVSVQIDAEGSRCLIALGGDGDGEGSFRTVSYDPELENQELSLPSANGGKKPSSEKKKKRKQPETPEGKATDSPANANPQMTNGKKSTEEKEDSRSLEARVSQMNINNKLISGGAAAAAGERENNSNNNKLTADSAAVLLSQALQSSDKQLLEQCLNVRQEQVISNTIKQLRSDQVGKLVPLLVERINSSSARAMQISCWIRHVVRHHLTYIISAPSIKGHLSVLYQHLEERQSSYTALLGLQGRLELLTTYIKSMRQQKQAQAQNGMMTDAAGAGNGDYYSDPAVVHVHENEDTETISLVPQIEQAEDDDDEDEEMEDAASSEEESSSEED